MKLTHVMMVVVCGILQVNSILGATINYNLKMKVDNLYFAPKEVDGTELRPILYEESIYLPVKALTEAIGIQVEMKDEVLIINSKEPQSIADEKAPYIKKNETVNVEIKNDIQVEINGRAVECRVISYKDRSYLPVRVLAEELGIPINYNKELEMILIGNSSILTSDYEVKSYSITNEEIQKKIASLRKKFPHDKYWNTVGVPEEKGTSDTITNTPCNHNEEMQIAGMGSTSNTCNSYRGVTGGGIQCYGFATKIQDEIFGLDAPVFTHTSYEQAKVGDHVRLPYHSVVIIEKTKDYIVVAEANYAKPCKINWDRKVYRKSLQDAYYITRY